MHDFGNGPSYNGDGAYPEAALLLSGGTLFGTAIRGGESTYFYYLAGGGTIFALSTNGSNFATLHSFYYATDGSDVWSPLLLAEILCMAQPRIVAVSVTGLSFAFD